MIPYLDLKAQYHTIKGEIDAAVLRVLDSTQFILGEEVAAFEREFAAYCHASESVGVNSGTSALHLALLAAGIGSGDEVITTPFTFVATVAAIRYAGATPVFVDIEPDYFTIDPAKIESAITRRTRVIMPVHLYGQPADMKPILEIARTRGLMVIEDAAQAHGSEYHGRRCGSLSEIAAFSFYPGKNLGAYGEGGALTTTRCDLATTCRVLRDWGQEKRYEHRLKGFNYRMDGIQGAVLRVKLRHLEAWTERRAQVARWYTEALDPERVRSPKERPGCRHVHHVYVVRSDDRDGLRDALARQGIQTGIHYPIPVHLQPAHEDLGYHEGDFPVAEAAAREVLSLPIYPEMTRDQVQMVAVAVSEASQARTRG
jgi:dTDP-4-amino-4,6-dideoxygalactose transaminase